MKTIISKFKTLYYYIKFKVLEHTYKTKDGVLKYLFFKKNSDTLLIVFASFPPKNFPVYNNVRGFKDLLLDRLYIADTWGFRASYYLYENGLDTPCRITSSFIEKVLGGGNYKHIYTAGSSKGGTCALYYGLKYNVEHIFSGACQYNLGDYLSVPVHIPILKAMMGSTSDTVIKLLNEVMPAHIEQHKNSNTCVHLVYSTEEHTYAEHTVDLIHKLNCCNITHIDEIHKFKEHREIGSYYLAYVTNFIKINRK